MIEDNLNNYENISDEWHCSKCVILHRASIFPFGLESNYDIQGILESDSMKIFEKLPKFKIVSKTNKYDSLSEHNLDENLINNIDSKYYSVSQLNKVPI